MWRAGRTYSVFPSASLLEFYPYAVWINIPYVSTYLWWVCARCMCVYIHKSIHARMKLYFTPDWPVRCEFNFILNSYDFVSARRTTSADLPLSSGRYLLFVSDRFEGNVDSMYIPARGARAYLTSSESWCVSCWQPSWLHDVGSSQCLLSVGRYLLFVSGRSEGNVRTCGCPEEEE